MQAAELREILDEMARIHGEEALEEIEVRFAGQQGTGSLKGRNFQGNYI